MNRAALVVYLAVALAGRAHGGSHDILFRLSEPGQVSLAVYDMHGKMLRELARGMNLEAGEHRFAWDGLNRYGQPAPAGQYEWRLLRTPGFTREFLVNIGTNPGWTPFDLWPGNHGGPTTLMLDADSNLYIGSISSEGPPHLLKMSTDGHKKYWSTGTWGLRDGLIGMARIGEVVYLLFWDGTIDIRRAQNGERFWGHPKLRKFPDKSLPFADLVHPNDPDAQKRPEERKRVLDLGFAASKDFLVVTYPKYNEVRFFWPKDDAIARTNIVHVPEPKGCCVARDGRVFVVSGKSVIRVNPETGEVRTVVTDTELVSPTRVAYDPANDDLLVAQHAENLDHVRRYRAADGKRVAIYGRAGGRTYGVFHPLDWGGLLDIVADGEGGFFTVEEFPRRVAHFRGREQHELVAQWIGGMQWGSLCALDPADPSIAYFCPDHKHCGRARVDYVGRTWTLTHLYELPEGFSWTLGKETHRAMFPGFGGMSYWEVRHVAGTTFLVNNGRMQGGCAAVVRVDEQENRLVPVAILGGLHPTLDRIKPPSWWLAAMKRAGFDPKGSGYLHFGFSWSDTNHNGKIDVEEINPGSLGSTYAEAHCFVDAQWNVYHTAGPQVSAAARGSRMGAKKPDQSIWLVVTNEGRADLPCWNWDHAQRASATFPECEVSLGATSIQGIYCDPRGDTYTVCNAENDSRQADVPPLTWPNSFTHASRLQKWNSAGQLEWSAGLHTASKQRPPGQFAHLRGILSEVRDCLVVLDACEPASVWTSDGLFAGSLYGQRLDDGLPDLAYNRIYHDDNHWGLVLETRPITGQGSTLNPQPSTLDTLWGGMSDNSTPIYRIRGWDHWERQSGRLVVSNPAPAARWKGSGLSAEYFANSDLSGTPKLRRRDADIWFGPMWGDHSEVVARSTWFSKAESLGLSPGNCSARWTGFFEPPLSENFTFVVYTYGETTLDRQQKKRISGSKIRLWVNGQLVINEWQDVKPEKINKWVRTRPCTSDPVTLIAGQPVPIKLEYVAAGDDEAHLHLFASSDSFDLRHVPHALLYPELRK